MALALLTAYYCFNPQGVLARKLRSRCLGCKMQFLHINRQQQTQFNQNEVKIR